MKRLSLFVSSVWILWATIVSAAPATDLPESLARLGTDCTQHSDPPGSRFSKAICREGKVQELLSDHGDRVRSEGPGKIGGVSPYDDDGVTDCDDGRFSTLIGTPPGSVGSPNSGQAFNSLQWYTDEDNGPYDNHNLDGIFYKDGSFRPGDVVRGQTIQAGRHWAGLWNPLCRGRWTMNDPDETDSTYRSSFNAGKLYVNHQGKCDGNSWCRPSRAGACYRGEDGSGDLVWGASDGRSVVSATPLDNPIRRFAGARCPNATALAFWSAALCGPNKYCMGETDIVVNSDPSIRYCAEAAFNFSVYPYHCGYQPNPGGISLRNVMQHEFGHMLGYDHPCQGQSNPYCGDNIMSSDTGTSVYVGYGDQAIHRFYYP